MPSSKPTAHLLVDGYNIIGAWPFLRKARDRYGLETARQDLVQAMSSYVAFQGYEAEIVFDAQFINRAGVREPILDGLWVCYTDQHQTADTYIEKTCARFFEHVQNLRRRLIVATSDRAQQLTVTGYGAEWMSAQQLLADLEFSEKTMMQKLQARRKPTRKLLSNTIDPVIQKRLAQMRLGIPGK